MIRWLVGQLHVGESDNAVRDAVRQKIRKRKGMTDDDFKTALEALLRQAVEIHHENQDTYMAVMYPGRKWRRQ